MNIFYSKFIIPSQFLCIRSSPIFFFVGSHSHKQGYSEKHSVLLLCAKPTPTYVRKAVAPIPCTCDTAVVDFPYIIERKTFVSVRAIVGWLAVCSFRPRIAAAVLVGEVHQASSGAGEAGGSDQRKDEEEEGYHTSKRRASSSSLCMLYYERKYIRRQTDVFWNVLGFGYNIYFEYII